MPNSRNDSNKFIDTLGVALLAAFLGAAAVLLLGVLLILFTLGEPPIAVSWLLWKGPLAFGAVCAAMAAIDVESSADMVGEAWAAIASVFTSEED